MRRVPFLGALVAFWGVVGVARAEPTTRIAIAGGARVNTGDLSDRYQFGWVWGFDASYQPSILGFGWSVYFSRTYSSDVRNVADQLNMVELDFGPRMRFQLSGVGDLSINAILRAGVDFARVSFPLEQGDDRSYLGASTEGGIEFVIGDNVSLMLGSRYGLLFADGPTGFGIQISAGFGTP